MKYRNTPTWAIALAILFSLVVCSNAVGCVTSGTGAGEFGLGYSSTSRVFFYQDVDGDKVNKTFTSKVKVQAFEDWLRSKIDPAMTPETTDETPE